MTVSATREIELPLFHLGKYRAQDGTDVVFTTDMLRAMERNTNLAIRAGKFQPPIGYDHPAAKDTNAHGFIKAVRYDNGKLIAKLAGTSEQLRKDAASFRRLTYSPEFHPKFSFVHDGKPVELGPTVVGLAMLGAQRGAIKNSQMVPLSEVQFGENVDGVEALLLRQDLREMGYVGEYEVDGKMFGEVENDVRRFAETETETTMTDAEIKALVDGAVKTATAPLVAQIATQEQTIKSFSERSANETEVKEFCEKVQKNPRLTVLGVDRLKAILTHEAVVKNPDLNTNIRAFVEGISPAVMPKGVAGADKGKGKETPDDDEPDEPEALAKIRIRHFGERSDPKHEALLDAAVIAFGEFKPEAFKGIENNPDAQLQRVATYVRRRDLGDADANADA